MLDMLRGLIWFFLVACAIAYLVFIVLGSTISANAIDGSRIVSVRDSLAPGAHYLSGIVMVHYTCAQLTVHSEKVSDTLYTLQFTTWNEPSVPCTEEDTARSFRAVVFAPAAGIHFTASLDDTPLELAVFQTVAATP